MDRIMNHLYYILMDIQIKKIFWNDGTNTSAARSSGIV